MIGSTDHDRIQVFVEQHFAIIPIALGILILGLIHFFLIKLIGEHFSLLRTFGIHIANGHNPGVVELKRIVHIVAQSNTTASDLPDIDLVARGMFTEYTGRYDTGEAHHGGRA